MKFYKNTGFGIKKYCANFQDKIPYKNGCIRANKVTFCDGDSQCSTRGQHTELQSYIKLSEFRRIWPSLNMNCLLLQSREMNSLLLNTSFELVKKNYFNMIVQSIEQLKF